MNAPLNPIRMTGAAPVAAPAAVQVRHMLAGKALLASVTVRGWSARKLDKSASDRTNRDHGAADDASRVNKLLVNRESLAELVAISNKVRELFYRLTLPWMDTGVRLLPAAHYLEFANGMRDLDRKHGAAVARFLDSYPTLRADARARLGDMFNESDYPSESNIRRRFYCGFTISEMSRGASDDFRLSLGDAGAAIVAADLESSLRRTVQTATADIFQRVADAVRRVAETLPAFAPAAADGSAKASGVFRDSLVTNLRELVATLPALNVFDDSRVAEIGAKLAELAKPEPDALRENADLRTETANAAAAILATVESYI